MNTGGKSIPKLISPVTPLDKLMAIDYELKILPVLAAILQHNNNYPNITDFDLRDFIENMRRNSVVEDAFAGKDFDKPKDKVCPTKCQWNFFNERVLDNLLKKNFTDRTLSSLYEQGLFINPPPKPLGGGCLEIEKNPQYIHGNPYCVDFLSDLLLNTDNKIQRNTCIPSHNPTKSKTRDLGIYKIRIEETCILYDEFKNNNHIETFNSQATDSPYGINITSLLTLPFVGTVKNNDYPNETVIFFFCQYEFENEITLIEADIQIKNIFKIILENNAKLKESIKNCGNPPGKSSKKAILTPLLTKISNLNQVSVILSLCFFEDRNFQRYHHPLYHTRTYIERTLGWEETHCNGTNYIEIKIPE